MGEDLTSVNIHLLKNPELKNPVLVCGLPGSGFVGKLAVEHLIKELGAKIFGVVYSYNFPPQVIIKPNGTVDILKNELYYFKSKVSNDLILYTGDSQPITPEADYQVADKILELASELGTKKIFTLAAYITGGFVKEPKVYGTATEISAANDLSNYGVILMKEGAITGMNGLLVGLAKVRGMLGLSLLGETSGYIVDANASKAVLTIFSKIMNIEVDMTRLIEHAKNSEKIVKKLGQLRNSQDSHPEVGKQNNKNLGYIS